MKNILLTIVVTAHNEEKFIGKCLESILNSIKEKKEKIEIIVSINNSSDNTKEIVNEFAIKNNNIKIVGSTKPGPSVARNFGIKEANGEFLTFIDGDDFIDENIIKVIEIIETNKDVDYFLNTYVINKNGKTFIPEPAKNNKLYKKLDLHLFSSYFKLNTCFSSSSARIIKTKLIQENKLQYDECFFQMEDMLFGIQILNHMNTFMFINIPYYHYEVGHENSLTKSISKTRMLQGFTATQTAHDWIKQNIKDKKVAKVFRSFASLLSFSLIRRVKFLSSKDKEEVYKFFKNKNTILNYPHCFSTKIFYIFYKLFGIRFSLKFI